MFKELFDYLTPERYQSSICINGCSYEVPHSRSLFGRENGWCFKCKTKTVRPIAVLCEEVLDGIHPRTQNR